MSLEQLLLFAVLLLVPLLNFLVRRMRRHLAAGTRPGVEPDGSVTRPRAEAVAPPIARAARARQPLRRLEPPRAAAPARARRRPQVAVRSRSEARRGIVLMTVLGPCRALDGS